MPSVSSLDEVKKVKRSKVEKVKAAIKKKD